MRVKRIYFFCFLILLLLQSTLNVNANHIIGGDITVKYIGPGNVFEVSVNYYWDCSGTSLNNYPSNADVGLYKQVSNIKVAQYSLGLLGSPVKLDLGDSCLAFDGCIKVATYRQTVTIPNNPSGYYFSYQQNSRNTNIKNMVINIPSVPPSLAGVTIYSDIPDPSLHNSTPVFDDLPNGYLCINKTNKRSFKCTDADGDSLVYHLETPLDSKNKSATYVPPDAKPYTPVSWVTVPSTSYYNATNMIGGTPPMTIDPFTGEITATPDQIGIYVFDVRVEEYQRATSSSSAVKLGEIRRDLQYSAVLCENLPPVFTEPTESSFDVSAGDSLCFTVKLADPNLYDSVFISASSELFNQGANAPAISFSSVRGKKTVDTTFCIYTQCANARETPYTITFNGKDTSCYNNFHTYKSVDIRISDPGNGYLGGFLPNVFTPNGDHLNDNLKVANAAKNCYDEFVVKIYDRWGDKVYESTDFFFQWDGKHYKSGRELAEGVYFYSAKGVFQDRTTEKKGNITLLR